MKDALGVSGALGMLSRHVWAPDGALHRERKLMQFYVHYTVTMPPKEPQNLVAGPYSESEVLDQRRDIASYAGVTDAYVSDKHERVKA